MNDLELVKAIASLMDYEEDFFFVDNTNELYDAECCPIPPYVDLLGRCGAEHLHQSLITIQHWKDQK